MEKLLTAALLLALPAGAEVRFGMESQSYPLLRMTSSWKADDLNWEDPAEPREFWEGRFSHWALEGAPRLELFREKQKVDWTFSLALPYYLGFATDLRNGDKALEQRFREDYLNDAGMGVRVALGLGIGL